MNYKNILFSFFAIITLSYQTPVQADEYDLKDYMEIFALGAQGVKNLAIGVRTLKDMSTNDLDQALHNLNNITWDLVIPVIVGAIAAKEYHTGTSRSVKFATGTGAAVGAGLAAYIVGSVPKEVINKLISKATGIKYVIEEAI